MLEVQGKTVPGHEGFMQEIKTIGLSLAENHINRMKEQMLIEAIQDSIQNIPSRDWGYRSHVLRYGWSYDRDAWMGDIPKWLEEQVGLTFDSVTVNHYKEGQCIPPHIDSIRFGEPILVLSLGGDCTLRFSAKGEVIDIPVPARSLLTMSKGSRYEWQHEVLPCKEERFSVVYRKRDFRSVK